MCTYVCEWTCVMSGEMWGLVAILPVSMQWSSSIPASGKCLAISLVQCRIGESCLGSFYGEGLAQFLCVAALDLICNLLMWNAHARRNVVIVLHTYSPQLSIYVLMCVYVWWQLLEFKFLWTHTICRVHIFRCWNESSECPCAYVATSLVTSNSSVGSKEIFFPSLWNVFL